MHVPERDSSDWLDAWAALRNMGENIDDYMLMYAEDRRPGQALRVQFKHIDTRKYTVVTIGWGG